jgi:hypothetical protein
MNACNELRVCRVSPLTMLTRLQWFHLPLAEAGSIVLLKSAQKRTQRKTHSRTTLSMAYQCGAFLGRPD